jgi:uncharacterized protein YndB with AHSA1/START domain
MNGGGKRFTIVRTFDAPRAEVWRAWTDPTVAAAWWHPAGMRTPPESVTIDLRAGGSFSYTMIGPDGDEHPTTGSYLEVREPDHLAFTWGMPGDDPAEIPVITVDLSDTVDGRTEMTFHVEGVAGRPGDENFYDGWTEAFDVLDGLAAHSISPTSANS